MEFSTQDLSKIFKISLRTLRHYDEVGVLKPSCRFASGKRVYLQRDVFKLFQIIQYKQLGFELQEIKEFFDGNSMPDKEIFLNQKKSIETKIQKLKQAVNKLDKVLLYLDENPSQAIECIKTIDFETQMKKYIPKSVQAYKDSILEKAGVAGYAKMTEDSVENIAAAVEFGKSMGEFLNAIAQLCTKSAAPEEDKVQKLLHMHFKALKKINPYISDKRMYLNVSDMMFESVKNNPDSREQDQKLFSFLKECMTIYADKHLDK